jgi:D-methionine transport system substrate-binding protein
MKRHISIFILISILTLVSLILLPNTVMAITKDGDRTKVTIGYVSSYTEELWAPATKELAADGIDIVWVTFADYTLPNAALDAGEIDMNQFQHHTYLNNEIKTHGYKILPIADLTISAQCVYSQKIKSLSELKNGDKIAIPNDVVNTGRALIVLQAAGIIKFNPEAGLFPDVSDITENPHNVEFVLVDAAQIISFLPDVAAAVINPNYAIDYGLSPAKDPIFFDDPSFYKDTSYVLVLAIRSADEENPIFKRVAKAFRTDEQKKHILETYQGAIIPVW